MQVGTTQGDQDDGIEYFESYGLRASPPSGSEGLVLRVGGSRAESIAICFGNRKLTIEGVGPGEVALYDNNGASVVLRQTGNIEITPGQGGVVQLGGPTATLEVARKTDPTLADSTMATWISDVTTFLLAIAPGFNVAPPGTPVVSLGAGSVVPPIPPVDFGLIKSGGSGSTST
jgi:hypothetical protein